MLRLENVELFSRQSKILDTKILILYRKRCIHIVSIIVLTFEVRQYNIEDFRRFLPIFFIKLELNYINDKIICIKITYVL